MCWCDPWVRHGTGLWLMSGCKRWKRLIDGVAWPMNANPGPHSTVCVDHTAHQLITQSPTSSLSATRKESAAQNPVVTCYWIYDMIWYWIKMKLVTWYWILTYVWVELIFIVHVMSNYFAWLQSWAHFCELEEKPPIGSWQVLGGSYYSYRHARQI